MDIIYIYLWCVFGVAISFFLPIIISKSNLNEIKKAGNILLAVASLLIALLLLAMLEHELRTWNMALISGFTWQSTIDRLSIRLRKA